MDEIERKYLCSEKVKDILATCNTIRHIKQGYLKTELGMVELIVQKSQDKVSLNLEVENQYSFNLEIPREDAYTLRALVSNESFAKSDVIWSQFKLVTTDTLIVRVRIEDTKAWLTIKGPQKGISKKELEYPISIGVACTIWPHCVDKVVKDRYLVPYEKDVNLTWEIDLFKEENCGLILAEIELPTESYNVDLPSWVGQEVSTDFKYANNNLGKNPYNQWKIKS